MNTQNILLAFLIILSFSYTIFPVSARLFPDPSSIPGWLSSHAPPGAWDSYMNFTGCQHGKTYEGLSKIKNYFHHFGYIPNAPPSNFTDDFDDALEAAVRTYQKNFNLNVTGELDDATLSQIVRPRCGVADIINGKTAMNSGKSDTNTTATSSSKLKFHSVGHYTYFDGNPRWPEGTTELTYAFDPGNNLSDVVKSVFARAFSRWSEVTTINFTETTSFSDADVKVGFYTGNHGDGEPFDGVLGTLAHSFAPTDGRFHLDGAEDWIASGDVTTASLSTAVDLESVAVHEIGHLLGLGHSSIKDAIMYPTITAKTRKVKLNDDDIEGVQKLYGSNPHYTGTSTISSPDTSNGRRHVEFTWGLVSLLVVGVPYFVL